MVLGFLTLLTTISLASITSLAQNRNPKIVTTFLPIYLFTKAIAGSNSQVDILIPPGAEVHDYQATPNNIRSLAQGDILVMNGLGIEEFLDKLIANAGNSQLVQIDSSEGIEPIDDEEGHLHNHEGHHHDEAGHHHDEKKGHHHEEGNPHVWLDPILAQQQVANIRDGLIETDPGNALTYRRNANAYIRQLDDLHEEFRQRLKPFRGCRFIAFHDAFPYLAQRYGLVQIAVVELPEDSITPRDIQQIRNEAEEHNIKALLSESGVNDRRITSIAEDLNLSIEILDPLESGETNPQYYFQVMRNNLESLEKACQ